MSEEDAVKNPAWQPPQPGQPEQPEYPERYESEPPTLEQSGLSHEPEPAGQPEPASSAALPGPAASAALPGPAVPPERRRRKGAMLGLVAGTAVLSAIAGGAVTGAVVGQDNDADTGSSSYAGGDSSSDAGDDDTEDAEGELQVPDMGEWSLPDTFGGQSENTEAQKSDATDEQQVGVVDIVTRSSYAQGRAAGTGMVLTSDGRILTNNHVIEGATSITVRVVSTGEKYDASVVGYDTEQDVAVLQIDDVSGLDTVTTDADSTVAKGDEVTAVGNAGGDGGRASAAEGNVTDVSKSITVTSEQTGERTRIRDLIEVDADVVSGQSGGPLYDADGEVIGITTAASSGTQNITGYAVPIDRALEIADDIVAGEESGSVEVGYDAFLGIGLASDGTEATVADVYADTPAKEAGIEVGDTITSVGGEAVRSADGLVKTLAGYEPGDSVTIEWTGDEGSESATVELIEAPAG